MSMNPSSVERVAEIFRVLFDAGNRINPRQTAAVIRLAIQPADSIGFADSTDLVLQIVWYWNGQFFWDGTKYWSGEPPV